MSRSSQLPPAYQVIKTEGFIETMQLLRTSYPRINELVDGVDWALARNPHHFTLVMGSYYLWVSEKLSGTGFPRFKVLYKIDEENKKVVLLELDEIM